MKKARRRDVANTAAAIQQILRTQHLGQADIVAGAYAQGRYTDAKSRKIYAGTAPITCQSGKSKVVHARFVHNNRLADALHMQAGAAILHDAGVRAYYDELRGREVGHNAALRQLGNRLVGILHGCLKTTSSYDQHTAWSHRQNSSPLDTLSSWGV